MVSQRFSFLLLWLWAVAWPLAHQAQAQTSGLPDVNQPLRTGVKSPNDAAVVVSIEKYPLLDEQYGVPYASRDGDGFEHFLTYTRGVPMANLHRLQDRSATADQIKDAFHTALTEAKGGTIWFYFAGHGAASPEDRDQLILGADVPMNERLMAGHAVALKALQEKVAQSEVERAIFVIDACNVAFGNRFAAPVSLSLQSNPKPIILWSAASEGEKSGPLTKAKHGAFTYAALGAVRGWADGELNGHKDGIVTTDEASAFVKRFLKEQGVRDQNPQLLSDKDEQLSSEVRELSPVAGAISTSTTTETSLTPKPTPPASATPGGLSTSIATPHEPTKHFHVDAGNLVTAIALTTIGIGGISSGGWMKWNKAQSVADKRQESIEAFGRGEGQTYSKMKEKWDSQKDEARVWEGLGYTAISVGALLTLISIPYWIDSFHMSYDYSFQLQPGGFFVKGQW